MGQRDSVPPALPRLGKPPPRYRFFLNPHPDLRFTRCPQRGAQMRVRKLPLVIHIDPMQLVAVSATSAIRGGAQWFVWSLWCAAGGRIRRGGSLPATAARCHLS